MFIGRKKELEILEERYNSSKSSANLESTV